MRAPGKKGKGRRDEEEGILLRRKSERGREKESKRKETNSKSAAKFGSGLGKRGGRDSMRDLRKRRK